MVEGARTRGLCETTVLNSIRQPLRGEMAEWLKAHAWKACLGETLTWVRIPLSPPLATRSTRRSWNVAVLLPGEADTAPCSGGSALGLTSRNRGDSGYLPTTFKSIS